MPDERRGLDMDVRAHQIEELKKRRTHPHVSDDDPAEEAGPVVKTAPPTSLPVFLIVFVVLLLKVMAARLMIVGNIGPGTAILLEAIVLLALMSPVEILLPRKAVGYLVLDVVLTLLLASSAVYAAFFDRVLSLDAVRFVGQLGDVQGSVFALIEWYHVLFFVDLIALSGWLVYARGDLEWWHARGSRPSTKLVTSHALVAAVVLIAGLTGDIGVGSTTGLARENGLVRFQLAALFADPAEAAPLIVADPSDASAVQQAVWGLKGIDGSSPFDQKGVASGDNLIVIQIESLQRFAVDATVNGEPVMPVLNELASEGWDFPNTYFQVGIGNTSDSEFMFNTSIYPRADVASGERVEGKEVPALPKLMKDLGYETLSFHANDVGFWNRDVLHPALGFDTFYDIEFFGDDDIIGIGPSDEVLFDKSLPVLQGLASRNAPFYAYFITLTPHHPFEMPADKVRLEIPAEYEGTLVGRYLEAMNYEDWVIGEFVQDLKDSGIYEDTTIIIFGDHFGIDPLNIEPADEDVLADLLGRPYSVVDKMATPFMIHVPGQDSATVDRTIGQIDVLPTLAEIAGIDTSELVVFGKSAFDPTENLLGERYYLPSGSFINEEVVLVPDTGFDDATAYDLGNGDLRADGAATAAEFDRALQLLSLSDAYFEDLPRVSR